MKKGNAASDKQTNKDKLCHMWKKEFDEEFNEDQNYCQI